MPGPDAHELPSPEKREAHENIQMTDRSVVERFHFTLWELAGFRYFAQSLIASEIKSSENKLRSLV